MYLRSNVTPGVAVALVTDELTLILTMSPPPLFGSGFHLPCSVTKCIVGLRIIRASADF